MKPVLPSGLQPELLEDFYGESDEHLKHIREALGLLERSIGKAQADLPVVEELFRNFHSFKGISAIVGLRAAEDLAHSAEDFLRELSGGRATPTSSGLELLMRATQKLEQIVVAFRSGSPLPDYERVTRELKEVAGGQTTKNTNGSATSANTSDGLDSDIENARARGLVIWRCTFTPSRELDQRGVNVNSVRARLSGAGEILRANPKVFGEGEIAFVFLLGAQETPADITRWEADGISVELFEQNNSFPPEIPEGPGETPAEPAPSPFIAPSHVVRVDLNKLDDLMRIAGEMVIHRSRLDIQLDKAGRNGKHLEVEQLQEFHSAFGRSLRELREAIMRVRLVPVAEIFARMPFVVRDLARDTTKDVRLTLEGQQTELDKYLIERLKDPLLHLVRNAFSHAVESAEERIAAGKSPEANILLRAAARGDSVILQIRDDGRGIDPEIVARRAAELGLVVPTPLEGAGLLKLLCSPGFSTRGDADRAAGRGVGMAVVYNTVRELGGSIALESKVGKGTQFTLRLPLTLTVSETLIVSSGEQTCAIPQSFVTEVMQVAEDQIRTVNRVEVVPYRSGVLPVIRLSTMFHLEKTTRDRSALLVLSTERGSTGLVVDRIHGQKEVVVRAIRDPLVQVPGIIGATELGDGRPVLILDGTVLTSGAVRPHNVEPTEPVAETRNVGI